MASFYTAPYTFGSSPDSLAQNRQVYDNYNLRLAESDRDARQRAIDQQRENYIFAVKNQQEQDRQNQELAMRMADTSYNRNQGAQDRAFRMYQFGLGRDDQAPQEGESNRRFGIEDAARTRGLDIQDDRLDLADQIQKDKLAQYNQQTAEAKKQQVDDIQSALQRANIIVSATNPTPAPNSHLFGLWHTQQPRAVLTEDEAFSHALRDKTLSPYVDLFTWDVPNQRFTLRNQPASPQQYQFAPPTNPPMPQTNMAPSRPVFAPTNSPSPAVVSPFPAPAPMQVGSQFQPLNISPNGVGQPQNIVPVPRSRPPAYYNRVNQLIQSGVGGETAIAQAKREFNIQ